MRETIAKVHEQIYMKADISNYASGSEGQTLERQVSLHSQQSPGYFKSWDSFYAGTKYMNFLDGGER